ncbi:Nop16p ASCRUDRAFT_35064 [Ascoidea rubescens DSM 1968]|uniref:Nucleolar protein 16 n=1 Tax=Ascoidea rubescens DSM 1968 TaxID=1344418 RepID=A0A1D2VHE6_9ASCO|nr:hypothetical protein ASCRUDRAFT_35064 [Ascoidea rubescens DSM 1968]ODV61091.1 hypothetical protein ASCRUDRAFT_35064 [Ascoidea rubescens DSM 1968]
MVSVRKRRSKHSSVSRTTRKTKDKHRRIPASSNILISKNWDPKLTLIQNYRKLGLTSKLKKATGGKEKIIKPFYEDDDFLQKQKNLNNLINNGMNDVNMSGNNEEEIDENEIPEGEARIIRDKKTNQVIRVVHGKKKVNDDSDDGDNKMNQIKIVHSSNNASFIKELEEYASRPVIKVERRESERESSWLKSLYEKYGDDYKKMQWDKKMNIYQLTSNQIRGKMEKWKKRNSVQ